MLCQSLFGFISSVLKSNLFDRNFWLVVNKYLKFKQVQWIYQFDYSIDKLFKQCPQSKVQIDKPWFYGNIWIRFEWLPYMIYDGSRQQDFKYLRLKLSIDEMLAYLYSIQLVFADGIIAISNNPNISLRSA